jgi:hypothetical protein
MQTTNEPTSRCKKCGRSKPIGSFERLPGGHVRGTCHSCRNGARSTTREGRRAAPVIEQRFERPISGQRFLITSAQNATPVHAAFFETLTRAAQHLGAELIVIPLRYRNPTSRWTAGQDSDEWWAEPVVPYLLNVRKRLNANLVLAADVKTQPTASSPLTGFEALTGAESCVLGHTKMQLRTVPVPSGRLPKILTTTGACTRPNYTDTKAGKIGEFHHYLGAILVELQGKRFHLRQINADRRDGSFIDLGTLYTRTGTHPAPPALGLVLGDAHARFFCPQVDAATFGPGGIVETLDPRTLVFHDVFDGYAANPHHVGNPFIAAAKMRGKIGDVRAEVEHTVRFVAERTRGRTSVLVDSNHGDFLARWVLSKDWKTDPVNAEFYLETALAMFRSAQLTSGGAAYADPWAHWVERMRAGASIRCLGPDESFALGPNECSMHGHRGPNGARGTVRNLSNLGVRVISGHGHSPGIENGHYRVGTSTPLRLEYNHGPGNWLNTHCVVYANGRRALLNIIDGRWKA